MRAFYQKVILKHNGFHHVLMGIKDYLEVKNIYKRSSVLL